jgi:circadian clock protein KaiC
VTSDPFTTDIATTGIPGLDDVLAGGFPRGRLYLLQGNPGAGKTTLALQFLLEGARLGERCLYITLSETRRELEAVAVSHGWSLDSLDLFELEPRAEELEPYAQQTVFPTAEVELTEVMHTLLERVERVKPERVVFDSLSEIRLLAQHPLRYRRQILALKHYFSGSDCTVLLLDDLAYDQGEQQIQSLAHGVIALEQIAQLYGTDRRRLRVQKLRGVKFRSGYHDFVIERGGLRVYPRLIASEHVAGFIADKIPSGLPALDDLLGGGLERGSSALLMGPPGTGKSALVGQYAISVASRGQRAAMFTFEESVSVMLARADALGTGLRSHIEAGRIMVRQVNPAELSPGEFTQCVRETVEQGGARLVVVDSLNGYLQAMPQEQYLLSQLHELFTYLGHHGVVTLLTVAQHGIMGSSMTSPVDASYLADSVILMRYFEASGRIRKAISVIKKRTGVHEDMIREFMMDQGGLRIGAPLENFQGVLTGVPTYTGPSEPLLDKDHDGSVS